MNNYTISKNKYFTELHVKLAKKYLLSPNQIFYLRDAVLYRKLDKKAITEELQKKVDRRTNAIRHPSINKQVTSPKLQSDLDQTFNRMQLGLSLMHFIDICPDSVWREITQPSEFIPKPLKNSEKHFIRKTL